MSDLDEPMIRKITRAHFFVRVIVRRILGINYNMAIVIRRPRVIAPHVCFGYLVIRVVGSRRQVRFVSENFADLEYSGRRPPVSLFFSKARLVLPGEPCPPSDSIFAKQHGKRSSYRRPIPATRSLKQSQLSTHGIPSRRDTNDELRAIARNAIRICIDAQKHQKADHEVARDRHKAYKERILIIPPLVFTSEAGTRDDSLLAALM